MQQMRLKNRALLALFLFAFAMSLVAWSYNRPDWQTTISDGERITNQTYVGVGEKWFGELGLSVAFWVIVAAVLTTLVDQLIFLKVCYGLVLAAVTWLIFVYRDIYNFDTRQHEWTWGLHSPLFWLSLTATLAFVAWAIHPEIARRNRYGKIVIE